LAGKGLLTDRDIGSDEAQETIMLIELTPAGRLALSALNTPPVGLGKMGGET